MKSILIAMTLLLSASAFAAEPEIACYGTSGGEGFGFVIESMSSQPAQGVLFPTIDPGDQGLFNCVKQAPYVICRNQHEPAWHVKIEPTPHGDWATVYSEEYEGILSRMMSLDCRPR